MGLMRKINIVLIFMLIGVALVNDVVFSTTDMTSTLRLPMKFGRGMPKALAEKLIIHGGREELDMRVKKILNEEQQFEEFLGVGLKQIRSVKYDIINYQYENFGSVLRFIFEVGGRQISCYAKLRHSVHGKSGNPTDLEHQLTLISSDAGITPSSKVIADTLVSMEIENSIILGRLQFEDMPEWGKFFLDNREYFLREIGRQCGKLNKILGITQCDVGARHIIITKDKRVYLIDFSTIAMSGEPVSSFHGSRDDNTDIMRLKTNLFDLLCSWDSELYKKDFRRILGKEEYYAWLQEGYDEIEEKEGDRPTAELIAYCRRLNDRL